MSRCASEVTRSAPTDRTTRVAPDHRSIDRSSGYSYVAARTASDHRVDASKLSLRLGSCRLALFSHACVHRRRWRANAGGAHRARRQLVRAVQARPRRFTHYVAAVGADSSNYEALWKAARSEIDSGGSRARRIAARSVLRRPGSRYARRAIRVKPDDAEAHFHLARALGRRALSVGVRDRVKFATEVRAEALRGA